MRADILKKKWQKELNKDTLREENMDETRLDEKCQYRIQFGPYSWCDLSDNICLEDSGNPDFDEVCENNTAREENNGDV